MSTSTIVAQATPPGIGGIAVIRLSGSDSFAIAAQVFRPASRTKTVAAAKGYTCMYGQFFADTARIDDGIATFFRAPHSYTGEDVVELSCHGGSVLAARLIEACVQHGAAPAAAGEYTKRAFLNGRISLTQAEAVMDVISADGRTGAQLAQTALTGALAAKIDACKQALLALAGHMAAWVDFPEEDVPALEAEHLTKTLCATQATLQALVHSYAAGNVLRHGVDVAIVGSPNVGKSTLLNLLAGFQRVIVTPIAGTTRDVVEQPVTLAGVRLNLFDTAGLRDTGDVVEAEGIRRSHQTLQTAGLVLAVFDASAATTAQDMKLASLCAEKPAIAIINKTDLAPAFDEAQIAPCFRAVVRISAGTGDGLPALEAAVAEVLGVANIDPSAPALVSQRQYAQAVDALSAIQDALLALQEGFGLDAVTVCVDDALAALCRLSGEDASEAVIEEVFASFCVGK